MSFSANPLNASPHSFSQTFSTHSRQSSQSGVGRRSVTPVSPTMTYIDALDHLSTKLRIPASAVEPTSAMFDDGLVPGVCRLFLEGRCRQGSRCFQVHVNRDVLEVLRKEALETPSCCFFHGAPCNFEGLPLNLRVNVGGTLVGLHSMSPTNYLWGVYTEHGESQLDVPKSCICREHRRGLCRFGEECGFLHICREIVLDGDESVCSTGTNASQGQGKKFNSTSSASSFSQHSNSHYFQHYQQTQPRCRRAEANFSACQSYQGCSPNQGNTGYHYSNNWNYPPNAKSFPSTSYDIESHYGTEVVNSAHFGASTPQSNICPGIDVEGRRVACTIGAPRSRQSFTSHALKVSGDEGRGSVFCGPLLQPLGSAPARGATSTRHNPYGDPVPPQ
ncbi:hypothetical protein TRVL_04541 [Trypanosoma vivax]|uniref:C3H1-type domain-containing protein n=1 Tax=Trypanosoma vivax (strain Y486) TaxID=1055687 RepID=G0TY11_TRYVY|nr:hypothetical protein TRVL_04541 [Trypanosoma vivax]CCC48856.1 conserved hypothetical protein [Trypanosoma vivax Y486]